MTRGEVWCLLGLLCVFGLLTSQYFGREIDDVYIDLLFGRNLVEHGTIALDWERPPVEGFSSPLNVLLHALGYALGFENGLALAKWRALICACLAIVSTFLLLRRLTSTRVLPWIGAGLLVITPAYQYWAVAGLETPIYALLLVLSVQLLARPDLSLLSAVPVGLLAITRPEGPLYSSLCVAFVAFRAARSGWPPRPVLRRLGLWLALVIAIAAPYHIFRWTHFHSVFPNTYYAKVNEYVLPWRGVNYVTEFLLHYAPWVLVTLPLAWIPARKRGGALVLVWAFVLAQLVIAVRSGGDWMPNYRFTVQVLPLLAVAAMCGLQNLIDGLGHLRARVLARTATAPDPATQLGASWRRWLGGLLGGSAALCGFIWLTQECSSHDLGSPLVPDQSIISSALDYRSVAQRLVQECEHRGQAPSSATVALEPVGIVPFFSRLRVLDLSGKTNREIGTAPLRFGIRRVREQELWVADLVFAQAPEFFCMSGGMYAGHQIATVRDPRFRLWYSKIERIGDSIDVYARRDTPLTPPELRFINRLDELNVLTPATGKLDRIEPDAAVLQAQAALARGDSVFVNVQLNSSPRRVEPLLALGHAQVCARDNYDITLALLPGKQEPSVLLPAFPLSTAPNADAAFQRGGPAHSLEGAPAPYMRIDCAGVEDYNLLSLHPLDVSGQSLCLFEVSMRLERERGQESGLYWSTYRGPPGPDTMVDAGQVLVQATDEGWRTVGGLVPLEPDVRYFCVAVGGLRNAGSILLVRDARIVALSR